MRCSLSSALWPVLWIPMWDAAMVPVVPYLGRGKDCLCVPNKEYCAMEVLPLSVVSAYSSAPYTCRLGTRLCCEENPAQTDAKENTGYHLEDGALIVKVPSLQPYYDLQLRYSKANTTNDKVVLESRGNFNLESTTEEYTEFHPFNENYPNLADNVSRDVTEAPRRTFHMDQEMDDKSRLEVELPIDVMGKNVNSTGERVNETLTNVGNSSVIDAGGDSEYELQGYVANAANMTNSTLHRGEGFGSVSVNVEESTLWLGKLPTSSTEYSNLSSPKERLIEQSTSSLSNLSPDRKCQNPLISPAHILNPVWNALKYTYSLLTDSNNLTGDNAGNFTNSSITFPAAHMSSTVLPLQHSDIHVMGNGSDLPGTSVNSSSNIPISRNSSSFWLWFWG